MARPPIRAKRCRYTAEAVAPICGRQAKRFTAAIAAVQALLGGFQLQPFLVIGIRGEGD